MKHFVKSLVIMLLLAMTMVVQAQPSAPKPKRIYITLDVSGSMKGNKYVMANYVAQTIAVFCDEGDLVYVYYLGAKHDITGANGYKRLHIPFDNHNSSGGSTYYEISDLTQFLKDYCPNERYQDWLFIIGDGLWRWGKGSEEYDRTTLKLKETIEGGHLQVCYLQTGDLFTQSSEFTRFLEELNAPTVEIRKSDTTASSVLENSVSFANRILGFSDYPIQMQQASPSCLSFKSEFPLEKFLLTYQSNQMSSDIKVESAGIEGLSVESKVKGNPTTKPLIAQGKPALNGMVWELSGAQTIPANEGVKVCFNQDIDMGHFILYPYVDVNLHVRPWSVAMDTLLEPSLNHFLICDKEDKVLVKMSATDKGGNKFPPPLMRRMEVLLVAGNESHQAHYNEADTTFVVMLPMVEDEVTYYAKVESVGYFSRVTGMQSVRKSALVCPPEWVPLITLSTLMTESVRFDEMMNGDGIGGRIDDSLFRLVSAKGDFDVKTVAGPEFWMVESVGLSVNNDEITLVQKPKHDLCECVFPDTLRYVVTLQSSSGILYEGKLYEGFEIPVVVPVAQRSWKSRCWVFVAAFVGLLLLMIYIHALRKKNRFAKDASIKPVYYDRYGDEVDILGNVPLREDGFGPKLKRWFWPADERNSLYFDAPQVQGIGFVATESYARVNVLKSTIDPTKLLITGYDPEDDRDKSKSVPISNNDKIVVMKDESNEAGYLQFQAGEKRGGGGFRTFTLFLFLAALVAEGFISWLLLQSIFHF